MQIVHFNCSLDYYSPQNTFSMEREFSILPQEKVIIELQPPINNIKKKRLCVQLKNVSNKIILVQRNSSLADILKHSYIKHLLLWIDQPTLKYLKQRWLHGCYTYGYLKFAFTINNAMLGCGGIGAQCPI